MAGGTGTNLSLATAVVEVALGGVQPEEGGDEELAIAKGTLTLFELDDVARKSQKHGGAHMTPELLARSHLVAEALRKDARTAEITPSSDEDAVAMVLDAMAFYLSRRLADIHDAARRWPSLRQPHTLDYQHLVHIRRPDPKLPELFVGPDEDRRQRSSFRLTDKRGSAREIEQEIDYCLYCHERDKDSCSKGLHEKDGTLKKNPLGVELRGCPLGEKISEMHVMRRDGDPLAALALVTVDNPMCAGTGHRICNDCMKACVFQKQEPVNIPQIETRVLTEVLSLPWGLEIYLLLMRFNPLNVERPHARPYNGKNVLVVGLGPAGYTLAHHLASEGFGVAAIDGLKLEPLPASLTGRPSGVPDPIRDAKSIYGKLDERILLGFGGVSEYGITVRWDKNFLTLVYLSLARNRNVRMYGGVRFGGTVLLEDAWALGFDHVAIAAGAGRPTLIDIKNNLSRGIRKASDFLMALQLTGAYKKTSVANLQVSLPAIVIGGGLTAIDTATELLAYYLVQIEKTVERWELLEKTLSPDDLARVFDAEEKQEVQQHLAHGRALRAEREEAKREGRQPDVQKLLDSWGGVTLVYRKSLQESPAYRLNHEEVMKSLEEGVRYVENLAPTEAVLDEQGRVKAMRFGAPRRHEHRAARANRLRRGRDEPQRDLRARAPWHVRARQARPILPRLRSGRGRWQGHDEARRSHRCRVLHELLQPRRAHGVVLRRQPPVLRGQRRQSDGEREGRVLARRRAVPGDPHAGPRFAARARHRARQGVREARRRAHRQGARGQPPHADDRRGGRPRPDGGAQVPPGAVLSTAELRVAGADRRRDAPRDGGARAHGCVGRRRARAHGHDRPRDGR